MKINGREIPCLSAQRKCAALVKYTSVMALLSASTIAGANGIALNEQSASSAGTAYAGRSSSALDASTIYGNPAGRRSSRGATTLVMHRAVSQEQIRGTRYL